MASIFSRIIAGEIPGNIVWDDEHAVVLVDIRPISTGHCLVIPKQEIDHWVDLDVDVAAHLMRVAHAVGEAQVKLFDCERVGVIIAGYEVPHTHVHVIPTNSMRDMDFANADPSVSGEELARVADLIKEQLDASGYPVPA